MDRCVYRARRTTGPNTAQLIGDRIDRDGTGTGRIPGSLTPHSLRAAGTDPRPNRAAIIPTGRQEERSHVHVFGDFDPEEFWNSLTPPSKEYVDEPPGDDQVAAVEQELGYKLPPAYIELMKYQNGGIPKKTNHRTNERTSWSHDHVAITGIYSIGWTKACSLCGEFNSQFWVDEWGYPPIGVYFADCRSAGHDMICLDHRKCGPAGEPEVVHVDQERDYRITFLAANFEDFIRGLEGDDAFEEEASSRRNNGPGGRQSRWLEGVLGATSFDRGANVVKLPCM